MYLGVVIVVPQFVQGQECPCATNSCAAVNQDGSRFFFLELESSNSRVLWPETIFRNKKKNLTCSFSTFCTMSTSFLQRVYFPEYSVILS